MSNDPQTEENTASAAPVDGSTEEVRATDAVSEPVADVASDIDEHDSVIETDSVEADTEKAADTVETAPGASGVQALPYPAPENSGSDAATTKPVKKFWGMPRYVGLAVMSACVVIVLVIAALLVTNVVKQRAEERETTVGYYTSAVSKYVTVSDGFDKEISRAKERLESLKDSEVSKPEDRSAFGTAIKTADEVRNAVTVDRLNIDESSNEELNDGVSKFAVAKHKLEAAHTDLSVARADIDASVEAKTKADEAAAKAAAKAAAAPISFVDLSRAGESLKGNYYTFEGKVIQDSGSGSYRVSITADQGYSMVFWKDPIYILVVGEPSQRIIEDDIIKFTGQSAGLYSYESVMGASVTVPLVMVEGADVSVTGHDN